MLHLNPALRIILTAEKVRLDSIATVNTSGSVTSFDSSGLTVSGLTKSAILFAVFTGSQHALTSCIWDPTGANQAATFIGARNNSSSLNRCELWGLLNPVSGNNVIRVTVASADVFVVMAVSLYNVNQNFNTAFANFAVSNVGSINIASSAGHMPFGVIFCQSGNSTLPGSQTLVCSGGTGGFRDNLLRSLYPNSSTSFTGTGVGVTNACGVDVVP